MAQQESDREDLMREATALRSRIEFEMPDQDETVVAGFHEDDRFSIYFGPDPVFHFDAEGRLRRAYSDGALYRTLGRGLARMIRQRTETETVLNRYDLSDEQLQEFQQKIQHMMKDFLDRLSDDSVRVLQQIPTEIELQKRVLITVKRCIESEPWLAAPIKVTD